MKLTFFKQTRRTRVQELSLATLESLLEASRTGTSPQETLAELMDIGNRELRGENYAAWAAAELACQDGAVDSNSEASVGRLMEMDDLDFGRDPRVS